MFTCSWFSETLTIICLNVSPIYESLQVPHEDLTKFINKYISKFMNNLYIKKPVMFTVPKKQLYLLLPFMGKMSALGKSELTRSLHKRLNFCKVKIIFKLLILWKIILVLKMLSLNLYVLAKFIILHVEAAASYIGKTFRHMKVRVSEHQGILLEEVNI